MVFPRRNLPLPRRPFPFNPPAWVLPRPCTRLPLSPYCNPLSAQLRQPRYFLQRNQTIVLASFASMVSGSDSKKCCGHNTIKLVLPSPACSLKAGYTAHSTRFCALPCRFLLDSYANGPLLQGFCRRRTRFKSPRKPGRMLHAIGARPRSLTPSIHPKLGVKSRHQGLHRCALHRIFRPYLEISVPD